MQKILITGGSGLVGQGIKANIHFYPYYDFIFMSSKECDLTNYENTLQYLLSIQPTYVIHLAANVGGLFKNINHKVSMFQDNILMNLNILKACHELNINNVVSCLSTCIFPDKTSYPIDETMIHNGPPHWSNDGYAYAKRMLDVQSRLYREQYGRKYLCVIPTNIYGKYDNYNIDDSHVIPALIHKCYLAKQNNISLLIEGNGKPLRQFIYNEDLGKLILWTLFEYSKDNSDNIILSVDEDDEISIEKLVTLISKEFRYDNIKFQGDDKGQYKKTANNKRLRYFLPDFEFTAIEKGLSETIRWFQENYHSVRK